MTLLPTGDLTWMRAQQERAMPGTVYILSPTEASDGMGGYTESWGTVGTVTGRVYPMTRRAIGERIGGAQVIAETQWFVTLPYGTNITAKMRVKYDGRTWEVMKVNNDEMYQTAVRCELTAHNEETRV